MNEDKSNLKSRRSFLKTTGQVTAAGALAGVALPHVHAADDHKIKVSLIGCGGRGTGAAAQALGVSESLGPIELHSMVDVYQDKLDKAYTTLSNPKRPQIAEKVNVPKERQIVSFEGYKQAMDQLSPGDVAIFTTPLAFRWVFFEYAVKKGINVFMEKPVIADGPTARRMLELNKKAKAKNLKVGVGLMCRHSEARRELVERVRDGAIGEITNLRSYRQAGPIGSAFTPPYNKDEYPSELMYQIRRFHSFLWLSGGAVSDFLVHHVDEACWLKGEWPVRCMGNGGRHYRGNDVDQNFDTYACEYTFADGTKYDMFGRNVAGCHNEFAVYAHGSKGSAVMSNQSHHPAYSRIYKHHNIDRNYRNKRDDVAWRYPMDPREPNPYELEWEHLIEAIRRDQPYNEVDRGVMASAATSLGRMAAHTGQELEMDDFMNSDHEFSPNTKNITSPDSDTPLKADDKGAYAIPEPGVKKTREY